MREFRLGDDDQCEGLKVMLDPLVGDYPARLAQKRGDLAISHSGPIAGQAR